MKRCFFTGLVVILPILITFLVVRFLVNFLTDPFEKFVRYILSHFDFYSNGLWILDHNQIIYLISKVLILGGLLLLIFLLGLLSRIAILEAAFTLFEKLVKKIPVIRSVFRICKEMTNAFLSPKAEGTNQPALVPYPSEEQKSIGLIMSEFTSDLLGNDSDEFAAVLIPCTPNLTTGILCIFSKQDVCPIQMSANDAFAFIMAFGAVGSVGKPHFHLDKNSKQA